MAKNQNYCAFYVAEPFNPSALGAHATHDFCHYQMLKAWKGKDSTFPFQNAHDTTYNVRDGSDWEKTLKPRLRERLRNSKNIILFLSSETKNSRALREEIDYGINALNLPIIVIYPELKDYSDILDKNNSLKKTVINLFDSLPVFRDSRKKVPVLHLPFNKTLIQTGLLNKGFTSSSPKNAGDYKL